MMKARIYKPAKNAMQSGRGKTQHWILEYDCPTARLPESLMGWVSSGDTLNQVRLTFTTREAAITFAEKHALPYNVAIDHARRVKPRNYGDNFKYVAVEGA